FAVYVTTGDPANTENFVEVIPESVATGVMTQYTGNTSEYAGQMGYVAIRHFNCEGQFYLVVDDVTINYPREDGRIEPEWTVAENATSPYAIEGLAPETEYEVQVQTVGNEEWTESVRFTTLEEQTEPAVTPTELTEQEVGEDYATISWTGNGETSWNVRYRKHVENSLWDFEANADGWTMIDADGDGFNWEYYASEGNVTHSGTGVMCSISYDNTTYSPVEPDNWLVSPEVDLDGTLSFWAVGQDKNYAAEHFAVYASTGDPTNTASFVEIMPETITTAEMTEYTVDLSAYAGQKGYIAFRHFNCTDMFRLNIDDVTITVPEYEWTVVEGVTENPYTVEGLDGGVAYDFQVQAIGEAGDVSEWSETLTFTTSMPDAIVEVASETTANNVWYNINGARLNGKPTQKGIYILNGKKVMVK
ncbi:MAG: choice-of-anchor J domain-containing protein, partial [Prevotella sp.]|nr:choice-of-anchor J domain-containing protein [Prevotella sp.]